VDDVVQALLLVSKKGSLTGEVYNLGTGKCKTTTEIAATISKVLEITPKYNYTDNIRPGDPDIWLANIDRIKGLGFCPDFSFEDGIKKTVEWYQHATMNGS